MAALATILWVDSFSNSLMFNDIRVALRFLARRSAFTATAFLTLVIGVGLNSGIFSVLDAVVLRSLPFPASDRLVAVWQQDVKDGSPFVVSAANFLDLRKASAFEDVCAIEEFANRDVTLAEGRTPQNVRGVRISPGCFGVLRTLPAHGRAFISAEAELGSAPVVVLSHNLWVSRFGSDQSAIGRFIQLNGKSVRVIGVMPDHFQLPLVQADLYTPIQWTAAEAQERRIAEYLVLARLKPDSTVSTTQARLTALAQAWATAYPDSDKDVGLLVRPLQQEVVKSVRPALTALFCGSGCLLLLASLNIANLFGVRALDRQREVEIRASLGATRLQLLRHLVTEGMIIVTFGGGAGLALGSVAIKFFLTLFNDSVYFSLPRRSEIGLNWRVFAYTAVVCVLTALALSVFPVRHVIGKDQCSLKLQRLHKGRLRAALVTAQVSFSVALVITAGLLVRSYSHLQSADIGFSTNHVLAVTVALPTSADGRLYRNIDFCHRLLERESSLPGVDTAAAVRFLPMSGVASVWDISIPSAPQQQQSAAFHTISTPTYFRCMHIPLLLGRAFNASDGAGQPRVTILSLTAARKFFPDNPNPIGRYITIHDEKNAAWQVVGVVGDVRNLRPDIAVRPQVYVPFDQNPTGVLTVVVKADQNPLSLAFSSRQVAEGLNSGMAPRQVKSMSDVVDDASAQWRVSTELFSWFGVGALILSLVGMHSLVSLAVAQRTREIAIRLAIGSSYKRALLLVLRAAIGTTGIGAMLGLILIGVARQGLQSLLYGISPLDRAIIGCFVLGYFALAMLAAICAGLKLVSIQPSIALKYE